MVYDIPIPLFRAPFMLLARLGPISFSKLTALHTLQAGPRPETFVVNYTKRLCTFAQFSQVTSQFFLAQEW